MSRCRLTDDPHAWDFMYLLSDTKTFPIAVWGCACSAMKKVSMKWDFTKLHPDERVKHMRARAGVAAIIEESGDEQG